MPNIKNTRYVCSAIDKRGKDGETLLHLCFTNVTRLHTELAKRLLNIFPKMIYDIKIGEEYYGLILNKSANIKSSFFVSFLKFISKLFIV